MKIKPTTILRRAAEAVANAPTWDVTTKAKMAETFEQRYGWAACWDARSLLGEIQGWDDKKADRESHILLLLLAAEVADKPHSELNGQEKP